MLRLHSKLDEREKEESALKESERTNYAKIEKSTRPIKRTFLLRALPRQDKSASNSKRKRIVVNEESVASNVDHIASASADSCTNSIEDENKARHLIRSPVRTRGMRMNTRSSTRRGWLRSPRNSTKLRTARAKRTQAVIASKRKRPASSSSRGGSVGTSRGQRLRCDSKTLSHSSPTEAASQWIQMYHSWPVVERLAALSHLVEVCEMAEVRHLLAVVEPQFQRDFISLLPKELALYVLSFLEPRDLCHAAQTCQTWRVLAEDNLLWREKCQREGTDDLTVLGTRCRRRGGKSAFKSLFVHQKRVELNWRSNPLRPPQVLKGHDDHVITCLEFNGHYIVSGSDDNTLKVWSAVTGNCHRTLVGHTGGVWSSQMVDTTIVSGSTDRTIRVWDAESGECLHILYGHSSTVRCLHLKHGVLVSGSRDATLRVWDVETGQCKHVLVGHMAAVRCVQYDGTRVVSGAYDYNVKIWDPDTETCLHTLTGHTDRVYSLQFDGVHIVSGSLDTSIRVWHAETGACISTLVGHQSLTSGMELKGNMLVSGNADSTVKVWNIVTGQCVHTLQGPNKHQSAVTSLQFSSRFVITSSDDGTVKLWDVRSGEFVRNLVTLDSRGSGGVVWRIRSTDTTLVCAVGSRNGTEDTKLLVMDFGVNDSSAKAAMTSVPTVATSEDNVQYGV